jgi:hypothetical protein
MDDRIQLVLSVDNMNGKVSGRESDVLDLIADTFNLAQEVRNEFIGRMSTYLTLLQKLPGNVVSLLAALLNHLPDSFQGDVEPLHSASRYSNEFVRTRNQRFERPADLEDRYSNSDEDDRLKKQYHCESR